MWLVVYNIGKDELYQVEISDEKLQDLIECWNKTPYPLVKGMDYSEYKFPRYPVRENAHH